MPTSADSRPPSAGAAGPFSASGERLGQAVNNRPSARTGTVLVYIVLALLALVPGAMLRLDLGFGGSLADAPLQALRHSLDEIHFGGGSRFWLGVAGFAMMALLILYPLRKVLATRFRVGSVGAWFHIHMVLGLAGPVLILYHCNFGLGGKNANVALWTMLIVVVSGVIGHFVYASVSAGFYAGKEKARQQLDAIAATLTSLNCRHDACRSYIADLEAFEAELLTPRQGIISSVKARWRVEKRRSQLGRGAANLLRDCAGELRLGQPDYERLRAVVGAHLANYVRFARHASSRSVREQFWARWRLFHLPVFLVMLAATGLHIYAVWDHEALFASRKEVVAEASELPAAPVPPVIEKKSAPAGTVLIEKRVVTTTPVAAAPAALEVPAAPVAAPVERPPVVVQRVPAPKPALKPGTTIADLLEPEANTATAAPPPAKPAVKRVVEVPQKAVPEPPAARPEPPRPVVQPAAKTPVTSQPAAPAAVAAAPASPPPPTAEERTAMKELQRRTEDQRMGLGGAKPRTLAEQISALKEKQRLQQFFHSETETGFPLTGKHVKVDCAACHKAPLHDQRQAKVRTCIDCHRKDDIHRGKRPDCAACHTTNRWSQIVRRR